METLIYLGKMIVCSAVMMGYYHLFLKDKTFHHYNRFYLLATIFISILLPMLKVNHFTIATENRWWLLMNNFPTQTIDSPQKFQWLLLGKYVLMAISVVLILKLFLGISRIYRMKKTFEKETWKGIHFYNTDLSDAPFSFFKNLFWKKSIALDSDLGKQILKHEMVHIEQKHTWDKILVELFRAVFWFNPVFYFIQKELYLIHEYLADAKAVKNKDPKRFAEMILSQNFAGSTLPATSPFLSSNLKKRLKMLKNPKKTKYSYIRRLMALPILFLIGFVYLVNAKNKEIAKTNAQLNKMVQASIQQDTLVKPTFKSEIDFDSAPFLTQIEKADANSIFKINGKAVTKSDFIDFYQTEKNAKYAISSVLNQKTSKKFEAFDGNYKGKLPESILPEKALAADSENHKNEIENAVQDIFKFKEMLHDPEFIKEMSGFGNDTIAMKKYFNSSEFKAQLEDMKKSAEVLKKYYDSPEFQRQIENTKKEAERLAKKYNSPEYKAKIEEIRKKAEEAAKKYNSPEFKAQIENIKRESKELAKYYQSDAFKNSLNQLRSSARIKAVNQNKLIEELKKDLQEKGMKESDIQEILEKTKKNMNLPNAFLMLNGKATFNNSNPKSFSLTNTNPQDIDVYVDGIKTEMSLLDDLSPEDIEFIRVTKKEGKGKIDIHTK